MTRYFGKAALAGLIAGIALAASARAQSNMDQMMAQPPQTQPQTPVVPPVMDIAPQTNAIPAEIKPKPKPKPKAPAVATKPFKGNVVSFDDIMKTITVQEKDQTVYQITSETHIFKKGKPAILKDAEAGETVTGDYVKEKSGKISLKTLKLGGLPSSSSAGGTNAPASDAIAH
jgi:hypothetical protein